jgi:Flp pilus assembly protein TadD
MIGDAKPSDAAQSSAGVFQQAAALHELGKFAEAEALLQEGIARDPTNPDLRNARGVMFAAMGRHLDALWCYRDAIALGPRAAGIWTNLGNTLALQKFFVSAIDSHRRAIALSKEPSALLYHNLGTALAEANRHGEAVIAFTQALERDPAYHIARWDRARSYLYLGNFQQGWSDYEIRKVTGQLPKREVPGRPWDGRPYAGKRLLLLVEQGFGDTLWVARYLPRVKALGGELLIECQKEVLPVIEEMRVADHLIERGQTLPTADLHCYLCSLPGLFTPDISAIPAIPYLSAPSDRRAKFAPAFERVAEDRLKVGIVWSGSVTFKKNHERAQPLMRFFQAFALPRVQLYGLQKGPRLGELTSLPKGGPIVDLAPLLDDFLDTAAAISHLDLIIPWYPTVRLFRPRVEGDWDYVFDSASVALTALTGI